MLFPNTWYSSSFCELWRSTCWDYNDQMFPLSSKSRHQQCIAGSALTNLFPWLSGTGSPYLGLTLSLDSFDGWVVVWLISVLTFIQILFPTIMWHLLTSTSISFYMNIDINRISRKTWEKILWNRKKKLGYLSVTDCGPYYSHFFQELLNNTQTTTEVLYSESGVMSRDSRRIYILSHFIPIQSLHN